MASKAADCGADNSSHVTGEEHDKGVGAVRSICPGRNQQSHLGTEIRSRALGLPLCWIGAEGKVNQVGAARI